LQTDMFSILVRFRKELVALVGDVSQMYLELALTTEDRPLLRFLWRDFIREKGARSLRILKICIWGLLLYLLCTVYKAYMDMPSVESVEMAKEVRKQLTELENKAGFHICKWVSQKPEVIEDIPATDRAAEVDL